MADVVVGGLRLRYEADGQGQPLMLVHGSWDDHHGWDLLVPFLLPSYRVFRYDRRGHGGSACPPGQGRISEDVTDLAGLIEELTTGPVHVVGHSYGATIALLLALDRPELCQTVTVHEPPLFGLLAGTSQAPLLAQVRARMEQVVSLLTDGQVERGTRLFVDEVGFGPGTWEHVLTPRLRETFIAHADTWLDQARDPGRLALEAARLATISVPVTITMGDQSLPWYAPVMHTIADAVPDAGLGVIAGSAHAPHLTHPAEFAAAVTARAQCQPSAR